MNGPGTSEWTDVVLKASTNPAPTSTGTQISSPLKALPCPYRNDFLPFPERCSDGMQAPDHSGKIYGRQFRWWPHSKPTQHFRQVQPTDKSGKCNEFRTNQQQPGKKEAILPPAKEVPSESERKRQRSWCVKDETVANHRTSYLMVINYNR